MSGMPDEATTRMIKDIVHHAAEEGTKRMLMILDNAIDDNDHRLSAAFAAAEAVYIGMVQGMAVTGLMRTDEFEEVFAHLGRHLRKNVEDICAARS